MGRQLFCFNCFVFIETIYTVLYLKYTALLIQILQRGLGRNFRGEGGSKKSSNKKMLFVESGHHLKKISEKRNCDFLSHSFMILGYENVNAFIMDYSLGFTLLYERFGI